MLSTIIFARIVTSDPTRTFLLDKNSKKYQIRVRLTNHEFSSNLLDTTSRPYKSLKTKLEDSVKNSVYSFYEFC